MDVRYVRMRWGESREWMRRLYSHPRTPPHLCQSSCAAWCCTTNNCTTTNYTTLDWTTLRELHQTGTNSTVYIRHHRSTVASHRVQYRQNSTPVPQHQWFHRSRPHHNRRHHIVPNKNSATLLHVTTCIWVGLNESSCKIATVQCSLYMMQYLHTHMHSTRTQCDERARASTYIHISGAKQRPAQVAPSHV